MTTGFVIFAGLVLLAVLIGGCISQPIHAPPTTRPTTEPVQTVVLQTPLPAPSITGNGWKLGWYDDTKGVWSSVIAGSTLTATFGVGEKVSGSGGCSLYTTDYHLGDTPKLWVRRPAVSAVQCTTPTGVFHQESVYFTDLQRAQNYSITNGQLLIFDQENRKILQFDPLS